MQGKQSTKKEISALKKSLEITRNCNKWLENQNIDSKQDINCLRQVSRSYCILRFHHNSK